MYRMITGQTLTGLRHIYILYVTDVVTHFIYVIYYIK